MKFEEEFPSLKGYTADFDEFDKCESAGVLFGCLGNEGPIIHIYDVQEHCLDKQKVKDAVMRLPDNNRKYILLNELGLDE